jgi:hypothetical protein
MLPYVIVYLSIGAVVSLVHPWIRGVIAEFCKDEVTGKHIFLKPILTCLLFVIVSIIWPICLWSAYKARKKPGNHFDELLNDPHIRKANPLFHAMLQMSADGTNSDEIPGSVGEFGLVATNPIPTMNIFGSRTYLDRLRTSDGQKVCYERRGSIVPEGANKPVDIYDLTNLQGDYVGTVYISPYHRKNSTKIPIGFLSRFPQRLGSEENQGGVSES